MSILIYCASANTAGTLTGLSYRAMSDESCLGFSTYCKDHQIPTNLNSKNFYGSPFSQNNAVGTVSFLTLELKKQSYENHESSWENHESCQHLGMGCIARALPILVFCAVVNTAWTRTGLNYCAMSRESCLGFPAYTKHLWIPQYPGSIFQW